MIILELFQTTAPIKVIKRTATRFTTSAIINNREIRFHAYSDFGWAVSFGELVPGARHETVKMTGSGGELEVLSMVKDSINMFISQYQPDMFTFTADKGDRSRASVYERMLKRLLPLGWKYEKRDVGADVEFVLSKS